MGNGDHGDHAVAEVESEGDVEQDASHPRQYRVEGLELQVPAHLRADELETPDLDLDPRRPLQRILHVLRQLIGLLRALGQPDQVLLGVAELLDDGVSELDLVETLPHQIHGRRLVVADLDQRSAGEVDPVVEATDEEDPDQAQEHEPARGGVEPSPLAHEIVVGIDEDLDHGDPRWKCSRPGDRACT